MGKSFSPPKGIRCFSTLRTATNSAKENKMFQSPEGDSLFFYQIDCQSRFSPSGQVSVPRRGFVVFLLGRTEFSGHLVHFRFSPPKGIRCFST